MKLNQLRQIGKRYFGYEELARVGRFKEKDFKVGPGSILEGDMRAYYTANGFVFLKERLTRMSLEIF